MGKRRRRRRRRRRRGRSRRRKKGRRREERRRRVTVRGKGRGMQIRHTPCIWRVSPPNCAPLNLWKQYQPLPWGTSVGEG